MLDNVKYVDTTVTVNGSSERQSTNGHYTGEHVGAPLQGYGETSANGDAHYREENIIRYGTLTRDNTANSMPTQYPWVVQTLTGCTSNFSAKSVDPTADFTATYTAATGYTLTGATIVVKIGGTTGVSGTDYTYSAGVLTIDDAKLTGDLDITVTAVEDAG